MGADFKPFERQLHEATEARTQELCGPDGYAAGREQGESMTLAAALELVLGPGAVD
jgi:hypothetical protein